MRIVLDSAVGANDNGPTISAILKLPSCLKTPKFEAQRISPGGASFFLAFPQVALLDLTGPWEVFSLANKIAGGDFPPYALELVSGDNAPTIRSSGGVIMECHTLAMNCRGAIDTLIVPATETVWTSQKSQFSPLLKRLADRSRRVASICGGAFLLAEAGILDGKRATTHWRGTNDLADRYPQVDVEPDAIFVQDGNIYKSAGVTAGIDLALALVEEDLGQAVALACARDLVVFMRRPGGQSQFSTTLKSQQADRDVINDLVAWAADHLCDDLSVKSLAERTNMSERNFSRVFGQEVGQTPAAFIEKLRV